jgi:hypothetical protein
MIVVTGAGRCGSSLLMQTLHLLGLPIFGDPLGGEFNTLAPFDDEGTLATAIRNKNPKGYWELDIGEVLKLCPDRFENHKGKFMKALASTFVYVGSDVIEKVILCLRKDEKAQTKSMYSLLDLERQINRKSDKHHGLVGDIIGHMDSWSEEDVQRSQKFGLEQVQQKISRDSLDCLPVYFEDMLQYPEETILTVAKFVGADTQNINKAVANVDKR